MENKAVLKAVAKYVSGEVDRDTLNKISELITTRAMQDKGSLDPVASKTFDQALSAWVKGKETPREFKALFRGDK